MATYTFETMTADQATSYNPTNDQIVFSNSGATATQVNVAFTTTSVAPSATSSGSLTVTGATITDLVDGHSVTFGTGIFGESDFIFGDSSKLFVGTTGNDPTTVSATDTHNDALFGSSGTDTLGAATMTGNLLLQGNMGADSLVGGTGNDTIYGGQDNDTIDGNVGKNFLEGNKGDDIITATASTTSDADTMLGGQGNDSIIGGAGADYLSGDLGADTIDASAGGNDTIFGVDGADSLKLGASAGVLSVDMGADNDSITDTAFTGGGTLSGGAGDDKITILGSVTHATILNGNAGNDTITAADPGAGGSYSIYGGQGDDTLDAHTFGATHGAYLDGNLGNDTILGGAGNDTILGEDGNDSITDAGGNNTITGGAGDDTIDLHSGAAGSNNIDGGAGNDSLVGTSGNDTITGGDGNDTIAGFGGTDFLTGGAGNDRFVISQGESPNAIGSQDRILDWQGGTAGTPTDTLHFDNALTAPTASTALALYSEHTAADYATATSLAAQDFANGHNFVAVQVGSDVVVFADSSTVNANANALDAGDDAVVLIGKTLADIDYSNIVN